MKTYTLIAALIFLTSCSMADVFKSRTKTDLKSISTSTEISKDTLSKEGVSLSTKSGKSKSENEYTRESWTMIPVKAGDSITNVYNYNSYPMTYTRETGTLKHESEFQNKDSTAFKEAMSSMHAKVDSLSIELKESQKIKTKEVSIWKIIWINLVIVAIVLLVLALVRWFRSRYSLSFIKKI